MFTFKIAAGNVYNHMKIIRSVHIKRIDLYRKCCGILGVDESADQTTVRNAYINLVKKVHPDSGSPEADAERFLEVDEAFQLLQRKFAKNRHDIYEDDEEEIPDIRHTVPQHRQYLNFDGIGIGNPFQREKQYQQAKAMKAQERVIKHRIDKSQLEEKALMKKGSSAKNHAKTKYGFERIVEDYIQEAMTRGDFDNLSGAGKPLTPAQQQNPYLDFTTHKLNKILLDNGFQPEWITLQRDIREASQQLKKKIAAERIYFGEYPLVGNELGLWENILDKYQCEVKEINKNIDKYNLIVPIMENQFFRINLNDVSEKILKDPNIPKSQKKPELAVDNSNTSSPQGKLNFFSFLGSWI